MYQDCLVDGIAQEISVNNTGDTFDFVYTFEGCKLLRLSITRPTVDALLWAVSLNVRNGLPTAISIPFANSTWRAESVQDSMDWRLPLCPDGPSSLSTLYIHMEVAAIETSILPYLSTKNCTLIKKLSYLGTYCI
jgi:hypothetical protein